MNDNFYKNLIQESPIGYAYHKIICDDDGIPCDYEFIEVNAGFEALTGLDRFDIIGRTVSEILPGMGTAEFNWIDFYGEVALNGEKKEFNQFSDALNKWYKINVYAPEKYFFICYFTDITDQKKTEDDLRKSQEHLANILEGTNVGTWEWNVQTGESVLLSNLPGMSYRCKYDPCWTMEFVSEGCHQLTGYTPEDLIDNHAVSYNDIILPEYRQWLWDTWKNAIHTHQLIQVEYRILTADHQEKWVWEQGLPIYDDKNQLEALEGLIVDITERKKAEKNLCYLSNHDDLTGVYNRRFYEAALKRLDIETNLPLTLVIADVNGLKLINDSFGNAIGDALLKRVAEVLKKRCRRNDIIARLGGDEFVMILPKTDVFEIVEIIKSLKVLFLQEKVEAIKPSISFGYETKEIEEENIQGIFKKAEDDMYRHKLYESSSTRSQTIELIMNTLYEKSHREMQHSQRVSEICKMIAIKMNFDKDAVNQIKIIGLIHDIGKMGIEENILNKPGKLNEDEWNEMRKHPEIGYRILSSVNEFSEMANYILEHHERWDGKGYPKGLCGKEISLQGRIVGVADAYDAMTSDRAYRMGLSEVEAIAEIKRCSGAQFDPEIAQLFIEMTLLKEIE